MANQQESKIEDFAFDYLKKYYTQQYSANNILVGQSEKTKRGNTADGIVAFKKSADEVFVANISMKHAQGLTKLLETYKKNGLGKLRFLTPLVVAALCFVLGRKMGSIPVILIVPVVVAPLSFLLHTYLLNRFRTRQVETILDSARSLPADEHWIGLSISSLAFRNNALARKTLELCQEKGLGLITVGRRSKVVLMQRPAASKASRRGDYLGYYSSETNIRRAINEDHVLRVA